MTITACFLIPCSVGFRTVGVSPMAQNGYGVAEENSEERQPALRLVSSGTVKFGQRFGRSFCATQC